MRPQPSGFPVVAAIAVFLASACAHPSAAPAPRPAPANQSASERIDDDINSRIRAEETQHSQVLETATMLSDISGPRLAGSSNYMSAARWARDRMMSWGLSNAALEPWGKRGRGWELERFSAEMTAPYYLRISAIPKSWSPPTSSVVAGQPVLVSVRSDSDFVRYRGKLRGAIVMNGGIAAPRNRFALMGERLTDAHLDSLSRMVDPGEPHTYWEDFDGYVIALAARNKVADFFREEGAVAVLEPSRTSDALGAGSFASYATERSGAVPALIVARDHYDRIVRIVQHGVPVRLELSINAHYTSNDSLGYNIVAELPGADPRLSSEVVMVGGHFDSWHAGTGATDNGAGVAVAMEALRVLMTVGARPRRTIRVALWDGEEQEDYFGSKGYVKRHFGDPETMQLLPEHSKLSAYFNVDNGTGKIRGIYLQSNAAVRPIFAAFLEPFRDLGATALTIKNEGGTDHMPFSAVGLPAFEVIQDPIDYETRTHHTNLDVADYLLEDDLKQASIVMASLLYRTASRDDKLPRLPLPAQHAAATGK
jgi:carboxypeptidase Q